MEPTDRFSYLTRVHPNRTASTRNVPARSTNRYGAYQTMNRGRPSRFVLLLKPWKKVRNVFDMSNEFLDTFHQVPSIPAFPANRYEERLQR